SGIGRGLFTVDQYRVVEAELLSQLGDGLIDATYFCPDVPGQHSSHRKPSPGMVFQAQQEHQLDLARSFFIVDKEIDVGCGPNAAVRTLRLKAVFDITPPGSAVDWFVKPLPAAAQIILDQPT